MSKRKNRKSAPNLPAETLERARQQIAREQEQAAGSDAPETAEPVEAPDAPVSVKVAAPAAESKPAPTPPAETAPRAAAPASAPRTVSSASRLAARRRANIEPVQAKGGRQERMTTDIIIDRLQHPTRIVTEDELRAVYSYVIRDIRSMAILAAGLVVALIVVALIFV